MRDVAPLHEQVMPVIPMTPEDIDRCCPAARVEDVLGMQKPSPADAIVMRAPHNKAP